MKRCQGLKSTLQHAWRLYLLPPTREERLLGSKGDGHSSKFAHHNLRWRGRILPIVSSIGARATHYGQSTTKFIVHPPRTSSTSVPTQYLRCKRVRGDIALISLDIASLGFMEHPVSRPKANGSTLRAQRLFIPNASSSGVETHLIHPMLAICSHLQVVCL